MPVHFDGDTLIIILTSPTGLGHIRVADALRRGISPQSQVVVMGEADRFAQVTHRIFSHSFGKGVFEFVQEQRLAEKPLTRVARKWLRSHPGSLTDQIMKAVSAQKVYPRRVILMVTHAMIGHQLAPLRESLAAALDVQLTLALVVTDDSPQEIWAVGGVDVVFVPSNSTREALLTYLLSNGDVIPEMVTAPYPISPTLSEALSLAEIKERRLQLSGKKLHICIPISGAAVGLQFSQAVSEILLADGYHVSVVIGDNPRVVEFITWCKQQNRLELLSDSENARVVALYDELYESTVIGAEITKPSEQSFKALCTPSDRGGSVLLFTAPVGRQEKDNLAYLRRHRLIPSLDDQARLNEWGLNGNRLHLTKELMVRAHHWRGVVLPSDGHHAGIMIERLIEAGVLSAMGDFQGFLEGHREINCHGVREIWEWIKTQS